jgi:hypothetical protein
MFAATLVSIFCRNLVLLTTKVLFPSAIPPARFAVPPMFPSLVEPAKKVRLGLISPDPDTHYRSLLRLQVYFGCW